MTTEQLTSKEKAEKVREHMRHTMGSEYIYRHHLNTIQYTDGMKCVAETCGAYWLLDAVASHQIYAKVSRETFQLWVLTSPQGDDHPWFLECWTDSPDVGECVASQEIPFSDFPVELANPTFEFYVEHGTALLKEER